MLASAAAADGAFPTPASATAARGDRPAARASAPSLYAFFSRMLSPVCCAGRAPQMLWHCGEVV